MAGGMMHYSKLAEMEDFDELMMYMKEQTQTVLVDQMMGKVKANRNLLYLKDKEGYTALQAGILSRCSADKLSHLLNFDKDIAAAAHQGRLPLHLALDIGANATVLELLIDAYPYALHLTDADHTLPLHKLLERQPFPSTHVELAKKVILLYPRAAAVRHDNKTALQISLEQNLMPGLILDILKTHRSAAAIQSKEGKYPLHIAAEGNLEPRIIWALLEAYPPALIVKMLPAGELTVLEYAIRNGLSDVVVKTLLTGGMIGEQDTGGKNPKAIAYARAAAMGNCTKEVRISEVLRTQQKSEKSSFDLAIDREAIARQRRRIRFYVVPYAGEELTVDMDPEERVESLKLKLQKMEGTATERMRLTFEGRQLMDGRRLAHYHIFKECRIEMRLRFDILQQALRHQSTADIVLALLKFRREAASEDDQFGILPLQLALQHRSEEAIVVKLLESYPQAAKIEVTGGAIGEYPLHLALRKGYSPTVIMALLADVTPVDWTPSGCYEPSGRGDAHTVLRPLHMCIRHADSTEGIIQVVRLLLDSRCPIESRDPITNFSALDIALSSGHVTEELFDLMWSNLSEKRRGIADEAGAHGQRPLHVAVIHKNNERVVDKLCRCSKEAMLSEDTDGRIPLHLACAHGCSFAVVRVLLYHCPESILKKDGQQRSPLQIAVTHKAAPGVVFEITRVAKDREMHEPGLVRAVLYMKDARGRSLLDLALGADAPPWVMQELLEAAPVAPMGVNLLGSKWPESKAATEALRVAYDTQKRSQRAANAATTSMRQALPKRKPGHRDHQHVTSPRSQLQQDMRLQLQLDLAALAEAEDRQQQENESSLLTVMQTTASRWFGW